MRRSLSPAWPALITISGIAVAMGWHVSVYLTKPDILPEAQAAPAMANTVPFAPVTIPVFNPPDQAGFAVAVNRNLFSAERKPVPVEVNAPSRRLDVPQQPPRPPAMILTGVALTENGGIAILAPQDRRGETLQLRAGAVHEGWKLDRLTTRSATFVQDGYEITLELDFTRD